MTLSMTLNAECCYAECHFNSFILNVTNKPIMLSVIVLNVVMVNVVMLNVVAPTAAAGSEP